MYNEILIDHTSVHALRPFTGPMDHLSVRANELLQLVENLLLADVVWICDTVTSETMRETMQYYKILLKHRVANSRSDGMVRIAQFTQEQILTAVKAASSLIKDTVARYGADDWRRLSGTMTYRMRPSGAQPVDFHSLAAIPFASQQAEDYIQTGLRELGWKTAALAPLLNAPLHLWLQGMVATFPDPASPVYDTLNTVFRWRYNEQLAMILTRPEAQPVDYVPAIGRAKSIEYLSELSWGARLRHVKLEASKAITARDEFGVMFGGLGPTIDYPLPLFGAWAVSQLNPGCTLDHLIEKICELKCSPEVISVKRWLVDADSASVSDFASELRRRLRTVEIASDDKAADGRIKVINPLIWLEECEGAGDPSMSLDALRRLQSKDSTVPAYAVSTILASMPHSFAAPAANSILMRVSELLNCSRDELVSTAPRACDLLPDVVIAEVSLPVANEVRTSATGAGSFCGSLVKQWEHFKKEDELREFVTVGDKPFKLLWYLFLEWKHDHNAWVKTSDLKDISVLDLESSAMSTSKRKVACALRLKYGESVRIEVRTERPAAYRLVVRDDSAAAGND